VSLFGGGSDYVEYSRSSPGVVVGGTIDKYVYVSINAISAFARERYRLTYRVTESVEDIVEIRHPIVRTTLSELRWNEPINIATMADVPGQTGLGSSSAFTVALRAGLAAYSGEVISAQALSDYALRIERVLLKEPGGVQDQLHPTHGGLRRYDLRGWSYAASPPLLEGEVLDEFSSHFLLAFTGSARSSQAPAQRTKRVVSDARRLDEVRQLASVADTASQGLLAARTVADAIDVTVWGLKEGWSLKHRLDPAIAPKSVTNAIQRGLDAGARAAKLLGSGGSGFVLFVVNPAHRKAVVDAFPQGYVLPFRFVETPLSVHDSLSPTQRNAVRRARFADD
jgi:D-glycero-alpha-D-manno-heptose-7-phosphate kinase